MILRKKFCLSLCAILAAACLASPAACADIRSRISKATKGFKDVTLTCRILYANHAELKKIGKDFAIQYEFKTATVRYKSPNKLKMEGKLGIVKAAVVINGDRKLTRFIYSKRENIRDKPHKRQTDFDIGIISDSLWRDYIITGTATQKASETSVYKITFVRGNSRGKKHICWVDPKTLKLLKVEKYESDGTLKSKYIYSNHSLINGLIWVPGRVDVYNQDGKLAGTSVYENVKVNTGIPDSVFKF